AAVRSVVVGRRWVGAVWSCDPEGGNDRSGGRQSKRGRGEAEPAGNEGDATEGRHRPEPAGVREYEQVETPREYQGTRQEEPSSPARGNRVRRHGEYPGHRQHRQRVVHLV